MNFSPMLFLNLKIPKLNIFYAMLITGTISCISLLASVPPVNRDALTHHLFIPKLYLRHGGVYEIPHLIVSYYPMNLDLLYLIPLYFKNDIIPTFIHFSFALITAAMIYQYVARRINRTYALFGALLFLSLPVIVRLSSTAYVDLGLICFLFASLLYLFDWVESGFKLKYLILSGVWCGLAVGTKYNGLIGLFLLSLFIVFVYARYHTGQNRYAVKAIGYCAAFVVTAMIVFSPWMVRNIAWTGNPVYPLYNQFFNSTESNLETKPDVQMEEQIPISHIRIRREIYGESWLQIALIPLRVFFQGQDDNPQYFDGKVNPFLLLLPLFAFWRIRYGTRQEKTEKLLLLFFSVLFLLYSCAHTATRIRYFSAILPPLVILSMYGLYNFQTQLLNRACFTSKFLKK
nr:phospholipid carrier-dependent glycosyltransferase [Desulfobacula sp.]